jgi:hypothetical protein
MAESEKSVLMYADHLPFTVRKRGKLIMLTRRYGDKVRLGPFRSWAAVERALDKYLADARARISKGTRRREPHEGQA